MHNAQSTQHLLATDHLKDHLRRNHSNNSSFIVKMLRTGTRKLTATVSQQYSFRCLSSEASSEGFFSRVKNAVTGSSSSSSSQDGQYAKQIAQMANAESWTLSNFHDQLKEASGGWKSKLPGIGKTDAVKQTKAMQQLLTATMEVMGDDADANVLKEAGRKEKVRIKPKIFGAVYTLTPFLLNFQ